MNEPENQNEIRELIDAMIDETLSDSQADRLNELLKDEAALQFYTQYLWMNESMSRHLGGHVTQIDEAIFDLQGKQITAAELSEKGMEMAAPAKIQSSNWQPDSRGLLQSNRLFFWTIAATLLALLAGAIFWASQSSNIDQLQPNVAFENPDPHPAKDSGIAGISLKTKTVQRQQLEDGTILISRSGSKFRIDKSRHIQLESGSIYLVVAKSDSPFVVETNAGSVSATGTRFTVSIENDSDDQTFAAVAQGKVVLETEEGGIELGAGQQGTLVKGQRPTRSPAPRFSYLVNWAKDALQQDELLVEELPKENGLIAIDPYGQEARLSLRKYNVDIYIEDGIARTTIDQTFFNHNPWNTEGTFYFPLPPDASVSRLAMYVFGKLNEGGMVSRERGQQIYTDILYQRRDPALLEMMEGNMFKMRIFPLEGRQEKRILLSYTQQLEELYGTMRYWFPMDHTQDVTRELSIRVRLKDGAGKFEPQSSTHDVVASTDGNDLLLEFDAKHVKPDQDFLLNLLRQQKVAVTDSPQKQATVAVCEQDDQHYMFAKIRPDLTADYQPEPRQWIVLNDVSASRTKIEAQAQSYILERLVAEADDEDSIYQIELNTEATAVSQQPVNVRSRQIRELLKHRAERLVGATNMEAGLKAAAQVIKEHQLENPHIVYLGDGVATDGEKSVTELPLQISNIATFVGIGVGKNTNALFLQEAADQTGGMFVTINPNEDIKWRVFDLIAALNTSRMTKVVVELLDVQNQPIEAIAYPSSRGIAAGESLSVVALCNEKLPVRLNLSGKLGENLIKQEISLENAKQNSNYIPRLWAKRHIDELLKSDMSSKEEIVKLSQQFYVVTPYTSLIVLEDDAMYQEYNVERGRKDHWAIYDAPAEIEVIKEPIKWNRWDWYAKFEGGDAKIDATAKPQTIQEIIDNIQIRINAPFYYWPKQTNESRLGLYQLCNSSFSEDFDPSRLLTLWFLLASGDSEAIQNWRSGEKSGQTIDQATASFGKRSSKEAELFYRPLLQQAFFKSRELRPFESFSLRVSRRTKFSGIRLIEQRLNSFSLASGFDFKKRLPSQRYGNSLPISGLNFASGLDGLTLFNSEMSLSFQQAVQTRWSRIERDIENYNRQQGHWQHGRNTWTVANPIDLQRSFGDGRWGRDALREIARDLRLESADRAGFDFFMAETRAFSEEMVSLDQLVANELFVGRSRSDFGLGSTLSSSGVFLFGENQSGPLRGHSIISDLMLPSLVADSPKSMAPGLFLAVSESPLRAQPGTASILAADYLHKRLDEIRAQSDYSTRMSEVLAIETALAAIAKASAKLENSGKFWGWNGWNYQPQSQSIHPPEVQAISGYNWSFDLTRYADGLYSNALDMLTEVNRHYGTDKPKGSISEEARIAIDRARANFQPVAIRFERNDTQLFVGPNDQYALQSRGEMYLDERLVCNGNNIIQYYDEIGMAARRAASEPRLAGLRQLVPHAIDPVASLIRNFDVTLESQNNEQFTLKISVVAEEPAVESETRRSDEEENDEKTNSDANLESAKPSGSHLLAQVDSQGRLQSKMLVVDDETVYKLTFSYDANVVTVRWLNDEEKELNQIVYEAAPFEPTSETFNTNLGEHVVFDLPIRKPNHYAEKLKSLAVKKRSDADVEGDIRQALRVEDYPEAIDLLRHRALSDLQDFGWRRWGQANEAVKKSLQQSIVLQIALNRKPERGELALLASAGYSGATETNFFATLNEDPIAKFADHRRQSDQVKDVFQNERGLIGHLLGYDIAYRRGGSSIEEFKEKFPDSPLVLALASQYGFQELLKLSRDDRWAGAALLMAAHRTGDETQTTAFTKAYWEWHDRLAEKERIPFLTDQMASTLQKVDQPKLRKFLQQQFEKIKTSGSTSEILSFAERVSAWGEKQLGDRAFELAVEKLGLAEVDSTTPLLNRFALAYALWAGKRHKKALAEFDAILDELSAKQIDTSPAFLAAMARLAQQAGHHQRAVELEEQALIAEQPFLPDMINLQAFRQRYQWLWNRYVSSVGEIGKDDPERESKIDRLLNRAAATWDRWREVDSKNPDLPAMMATLLKSADREQEAWKYLSSAIDQKPRDASSYFNVGQWFQGQGDWMNAARWYGEAPQWDTANPQWIYHHAAALKQLGRKKEARAEFQKIIDGEWAPGLQNWVDQAKGALD